jgi:hypothetical protein
VLPGDGWRVVGLNNLNKLCNATDPQLPINRRYTH